MQFNGRGTTGVEESDEVVEEAILREASREVLTLIVALLQYPIDQATAKIPQTQRQSEPSPIPVAQQTMAKPGQHRSFMQHAVESPQQRGIADAALHLAI